LGTNQTSKNQTAIKPEAESENETESY